VLHFTYLTSLGENVEEIVWAANSLRLGWCEWRERKNLKRWCEWRERSYPFCQINIRAYVSPKQPLTG